MGARRMSSGSEKVARAQGRGWSLTWARGSERAGLSEMRSGVQRGEPEGQRGSGLAWPVLKKFLDMRGGGISCLRSRVERRSSCSSEATGDPTGSAGAQGRHWGLAQGRSILSPGPGRRFPSPEAGQPPRALVPPHPHPRSLCTLRPRPSRMLSQDVGNPNGGRTEAPPSSESWCCLIYR